MSYQVYLDIWTFEEDIKPSAVNPYSTRISAHSIAIWSVTPDTWEHYTEENKNIKFLVKQGTNYHTIKSEFYQNGEYIPLLLNGGLTPDINDFKNYGFDKENDLVISNGEFRPIDKLDSQFSIVMGEYEPE